MIETGAGFHGLSRNLTTLLLCLLACAINYQFFFKTARVTVDVAVEQKTDFKLYWSGADQPFSEKRQAAVRVIPQQRVYSFSFTNLDAVERIRLDPIRYQGPATVAHITISQTGYRDYAVDLAYAEPLHDLAEYRVDEDGLHLVASGADPNFLIIPTFESAPVAWGSELLRYLFICLAVILIVQGGASLRPDFAYVPFMLAMVFALVVSMAAISKRNAHPDEMVHLAAAAYYQENWLPPRIEDPAIENTYSPYGVSRLNNGEIYYLIAGKVARAGQGLHMPPLFSLRLANIFLLGIVVLVAAASVPARLVALPLLISPQIWYVFSYCNSDALGLFLCFLGGWELVRPNSFINRIFTADSVRSFFFPAAAIAVLLALLLLLKSNYYPFIALAFLVVLWQLKIGVAHDHRRRALIRLVTVIAIGLALAGIRIGADYYVNGSDRGATLTRVQEERAHHWYKPSTELHEKHVSLNMKQRGTTLKAMILRHKWFEHSFVSAFGHYGYFTLASPERYYVIMKWAVSIFLCFIFLTAFIRGSTETRLLAAAVVLLSAGLIAVSLYRSWTIDFQAQGRYLFPIMSMLAVLLGRNRALFNGPLFTIQVWVLFGLSLFSFIFVALVFIPRPF